jgi:hypothetical protein
VDDHCAVQQRPALPFRARTIGHRKSSRHIARGILPIVAILYAELKWLFRTLMTSLIFPQVAIGVYNARMDHVCS